MNDRPPDQYTRCDARSTPTFDVWEWRFSKRFVTEIHVHWTDEQIVLTTGAITAIKTGSPGDEIVELDDRSDDAGPRKMHDWLEPYIERFHQLDEELDALAAED